MVSNDIYYLYRYIWYHGTAYILYFVTCDSQLKEGNQTEK
jgi:hypothetical protein